jgi:membrane protein DedA with SNARE-associated domain
MTVATVIGWIASYRYLILFPLVVIEGPIVTIIAGFLASLGQMNLLICYPLVVVGDIVGDLLMYAQGRWGGKPAVEKWGRRFGVKPSFVERLERHFAKHPGKTLVVGKLTQFFGGPILIAAGMAQMPILDFIWFNIIGTLPKSLILLLIGFYFGAAYATFDKIFNVAGLAVAAVIAIAVIVALIVVLARKKYLKEENHA